MYADTKKETIKTQWRSIIRMWSLTGNGSGIHWIEFSVFMHKCFSTWLPLTPYTTPKTPLRIPKTSQNTTYMRKSQGMDLKILAVLAPMHYRNVYCRFRGSPIESFCWEWEIKMVTSIVRRQEFETFIHKPSAPYRICW